MRLLLTRPVEDAAPLAALLREQGHEVLLAPLLEIRELAAPAPALDGVQAVLLTSANGARALARAAVDPATFSLPAFAVGEASAEAARQAGFTSVESADGDVAGLARLVVERLRPDAGALLHAAGTRLAGDLAGDLAGHGFEVRRAVLYEAATATALPEAAVTALTESRLDAVLLFSPRTAATFARLVAQAGLAAACPKLIAYCLSPAVAAKLAGLDWRRIAVARRPEQEHLLGLLLEEAK